MKRRRLGPFEVSAIGLGCMSMSWAYGESDPDESVRTLHRALDIGYSFFDTAAVYGRGRNETLLGDTLRGRRDEFVLASKCGLYYDDTGRRYIDGRPETIARTCEESLARLGVDVIDLYYLHRLDFTVPIEESVGALARLVEQGKVRAIGLSEVSSATLRRAHAVHPVTAVQSEYSLWTREPEKRMLATCRELGTVFVPFSPLARGFLSGRLRDTAALHPRDIRRQMPRFTPENYAANLRLLDGYEAVARRVGCTPAQLALAWLLARDPTLVPIPGTWHSAYAEENLAAVDIALDEATVDELDRLINNGTVHGPRYDAKTLPEIDQD